MNLAEVVIIWTCVLVFVATAVITLGALIGKVELGGKGGEHHHRYLNVLTATLILEIVVGGVAVFKLRTNPEPRFVGDSISDLTSQIVALKEYLQVQLPSIMPTEIDDPLPPPPPPQTRTLTERAYASSDGPKNKSVTIRIPKGWEFVSKDATVWTRNGNTSGPTIEEERLDGRVVAVTISVRAADRAIFGSRNWIGANLIVNLKEESQ